MKTHRALRRTSGYYAVRIAALVIALVCAACMLTSCGSADISSYGNDKITISGLKDDDFTVTPNDLSEMKCVSRTDTGATAKAGTVNAYGPLLETFVGKYGYTTDDFSRVTFKCRDSYEVSLKEEYLTDYDIVLSIASGSEALPEKEQPLRILVPEAESSKWAYSVERIEFTKK